MVLFFFTSCGTERDPIQKIKVGFKIPQLGNQKEFDTTQNPTNLSGFNCVLVFITYPDRAGGTCTDANGVTLAKPFDMVGMVPRPGGYLEAEVDVGPGRVFQLVGFNADLANLGGRCPSVFNDFTNIEIHLSEPFIISQIRADIFPVASQEIIFNSSFDVNKKIYDCTGPLFDQIASPPPTSVNLEPRPWRSKAAASKVTSASFKAHVSVGSNYLEQTSTNLKIKRNKIPVFKAP